MQRELMCVYICKCTEQGYLLLNYYGDTRCELVINGHSLWNFGVNDEQTMESLYNEYYLSLNS